jgi:hypothetical protein
MCIGQIVTNMSGAKVGDGAIIAANPRGIELAKKWLETIGYIIFYNTSCA